MLRRTDFQSVPGQTHWSPIPGQTDWKSVLHSPIEDLFSAQALRARCPTALRILAGPVRRQGQQLARSSADLDQTAGTHAATPLLAPIRSRRTLVAPLSIPRLRNPRSNIILVGAILRRACGACSLDGATGWAVTQILPSLENPNHENRPTTRSRRESRVCPAT